MSVLVYTVEPMCRKVALADIESMADGDPVAVTGELSALQLRRTALGEDWATMVLGQDDEAVMVMVVVRTFATVDKEVLAPDTPVQISGRVYLSSDGVTRIVASSVEAQSF
jgi:hypothetical protein